VYDLVKGHPLALDKLRKFHGFEIINLGRGTVNTVKE